MQRTRVGVIRGGPTPAYELSLKSGAALIHALPPETYDVRDIFIDRTGSWHVRGKPMPPSRALGQLDCAVIAVQGSYGEDGRLQRLLETHGVPYLGTDPFGCALAASKKIAKERVVEAGILTPVSVVITQDDLSRSRIISLFRTFPQPSIIKPLSGGSSIGVYVAQNYFEFERGIMEALAHASSVLIEEYIRGKEATVGIISAFRDEEHYALPPVELVHQTPYHHYPYEYKVHPPSTSRVFGSFSSDEKEEMMRIAKMAHQVLGLRDISRHDFIVAKRGILFLESNTIPELFEGTPTALSLDAMGISVPTVASHLVTRARARA
jgi:D-alanine-D-alanine ligase